MKQLLLMALLVCLTLIGCKTRQTKEQSVYQTEQLTQQTEQQQEHIEQSTFETLNVDAELRELRELVSNFKIDYKGEALDDKLVILMQKDEQGSKLTFEGKGEVNLSESQKNTIEIEFKQHLKRQDSIYSAIITKLDNLETHHQRSYVSEEKIVTKRSVPLAVYVWLGLALVVAFLAWRLKLFKLITN